MAKAGYNHGKPSGLGKLIPEASGKEGQKTLKAKGVGATSSKARVGYTPPTPVRIPIQKASVLMISIDDKEEEQPSKPSKKLSVFDRIGQPTPYILVFDRDVDDTLLMDQDSNKVRSPIPSRMKRRSIWEVNTGEALTAKKRTMVSTKWKVEDEVVALVNHIIITKVIKEESPIEDDAEDAPPTFEEGV
nr:hypothetical protein CFP56_42491 [Quercus suber]